MTQPQGLLTDAQIRARLRMGKLAVWPTPDQPTWDGLLAMCAWDVNQQILRLVTPSGILRYLDGRYDLFVRW